MNRWTPCKRAGFIRRLRKLGFEGPYSGTRHQFLIYHSNRLTIPSNTEYSVPQLRMMIKQVNVMIGRELTVDEWTLLE